MDKFFKLKENGTNVRTEIIAGMTTFITMAYIIFVNPLILSGTGMDKNAVFVATCISSVIATLIMAFVANVPFAQAAGMGMNSFFAAIVTTGFGPFKITWEQALALVFLCGIINIIITVTSVRQMLIRAVPTSLQHAIGAGIGIFITFIGLRLSGIVKTTENGVSLGSLSQPTVILAIVGIITIAVMMLLNVKGSMLIGIFAVTVLSIIFGVNKISPDFVPFSLPPSLEPTLFKLDIAGLFTALPFFTAVTLILSFSLSDTFDTLGTFIGTGRSTGIFSDDDIKSLGKGMKTKLEKALFADATATSIGAMLGTSNVTTYVESAAGISAGGKTGLTSLVVSIMMLLSLFIAPVVGIVPGYATSPALVIVGVLMVTSIIKVKFDELEEALPAFFTIVMMPFSGSIADGIAAGFIFYTLVKLVKGKAKEVHPIMYIFTVLFILNYVFRG